MKQSDAQSGDAALRADIQRQCRIAGCRITPPRAAVINTLCAMPEPRTAEDLRDTIALTGARVTLSSIYRTLAELTKIGAVTRFACGRGKARFALAVQSSAIWLRVGDGEEIVALKDPLIEQRLSAFASSLGVELRGAEIILTATPRAKAQPGYSETN